MTIPTVKPIRNGTGYKHGLIEKKNSSCMFMNDDGENDRSGGDGNNALTIDGIVFADVDDIITVANDRTTYTSTEERP